MGMGVGTGMGVQVRYAEREDAGNAMMALGMMRVYQCQNAKGDAATDLWQR